MIIENVIIGNKILSAYSLREVTLSRLLEFLQRSIKAVIVLLR